MKRLTLAAILCGASTAALAARIAAATGASVPYSSTSASASVAAARELKK